MTTHKNSAETNRLAALQLIADGKSLEGVHSSTLRALETKRLAKRRGDHWELLPNGRTLLNQADGTTYYLQMLHNNEWVPVLQGVGQPASFDNLGEAETASASCSIVNLVPVRIVTGSDLMPDSYTVYDFGRRFIEHVKGGRSAVPRLLETPDEPVHGENFQLFVVQRRSRHWANNGMFVPWVIARPTRFAALEDAVDAARTAAAQDTNAYEYRVSMEDVPELPSVVYVLEEVHPDLGILDAMTTLVAVPGDDEHTRKARAIGVMLAAWAIQPDLVIESCRSALTAAAQAADMPVIELYQKLTA